MGYEFIANAFHADYSEQGQALLTYLLEALRASELPPAPGQTISYGTSNIQLRAVENGVLELWEWDLERETFRPGVEHSTQVAQSQSSICSKYKSDFRPARLDQIIAVSCGVFDSLPVEGVRYEMADPHSGWILLTTEFNGNVDSLRPEHCVHVVRARPELAAVLALSAGFRFFKGEHELDVEFDPKVASAKLDLDDESRSRSEG
jgi:hypothetical protein